jgi:hypothetical protein
MFARSLPQTQSTPGFLRSHGLSPEMEPPKIPGGYRKTSMKALTDPPAGHHPSRILRGNSFPSSALPPPSSNVASCPTLKCPSPPSAFSPRAYFHSSHLPSPPHSPSDHSHSNASHRSVADNSCVSSCGLSSLASVMDDELEGTENEEDDDQVRGVAASVWSGS